jgi:hypothetical protein
MLESTQAPRPTEPAFQWMAVVEHADEMYDGKDKGKVQLSPA